MLRIAFSTVACPQWPLGRVIRSGAQWGYGGVEFRTFGYGSREFACDPAMTDPAKARRLLSEAGLHAASIATGIAFDEPIRPPVIGRVKDTESSIRGAKAAIEIAASIGAPFVRVFGFELRAAENRARGLARIAERLLLAADAARHSGVRLVLENGGSFCRAGEVRELIERVGSPLLGASYSAAVAADAGEDPVIGARSLADRLWVVKVKDRGADQRPCLPGDGELGCEPFVASLAADGFKGWVVFEWDRAWVPGLGPAESVLPEVASRLFRWVGDAPAPEQRRAVLV